MKRGRRAVGDLDGAVDGKRRTNWSQDDVERLAQFIIDHGRDGILNKQTNGATNAKKKMQWALIQNIFNSALTVIHCRILV